MPDTYDENEIAKLKHLNEFARQLNIKLNGGTDPKLDRTIAIQANRTLNGTTGISAIPGDDLELKLALDDTKPYDIEIRLPIGFEQGVLPYLSDISIVGEGLSTENSGWARTIYYANFYPISNLRGMWNMVIRIAKTIACTVTATFNVPETDQYKAYSRTLTWNISAKE